MRQPRIDASLADEIGGYFYDPLGYVLFAFDWGQGDLEGHEPDKWQIEYLTDLGDALKTGDPGEISRVIRLAVASGHGVGKSTLVAWLILWAMSTRPNLTGVVTANTQGQLTTKTWRELSVWHRRAINAFWFEKTATKFYAVSDPETWFVALVPWTEQNAEAFAGTHGDYVLMLMDEASSIPPIIWEVIEGATTTGEVIWAAFGNPTRSTGRFRECFGRYRHNWIGRQVDARECRLTNKTQIAEWADDYGEDSDFFRIRVTGQFPRQGSLEFISGADVDDAIARDAVPEGPKVLGVDVARFGDNKSVIAYRQGRKLVELWRYRGLDTQQFAGHIAEKIDEIEPDAVFIDGAGVGGGVVDRLVSLGYQVIEVNGGKAAHNDADYTNKRAEMWGLMRDWLRGADIPNDMELAADLIGPEYGFDNRNRIQLEKKEDMQKRGLASPDDADALSLTFAEPVRTHETIIDPLKAMKRAGRGSWMAA